MRVGQSEKERERTAPGRRPVEHARVDEEGAHRRGLDARLAQATQVHAHRVVEELAPSLGGAVCSAEKENSFSSLSKMGIALAPEYSIIDL